MTGNKKLSGYQKLKAENQLLREQIHTLVNSPNTVAAFEITQRVKAESALERSIYFGNIGAGSLTDETRFSGLVGNFNVQIS